MESLIIFGLAFVVGRLGTRWLLKRLLAEENARWQPHESPRPPKELSHFDGARE